jgi:3-hydroxybutyryl-CoA dehydrogenase
MMNEKIALIGAGTMGLDIATAFAAAGASVVVRDINETITQRAKARLEASLEKRVAKGKMSGEERDGILSRVSFTTLLEDCKDADLVIEAAIERADIKKQIFAQLDDICKESTILASNTSSISITDIASATKHPERVIGMHFFNPATVMKLTELIRGVFTSDETYDRTRALAEAAGKTPVQVNECPGFVVNRLLIPMINEAIGLWAEGIASKEDIDTAMKLGCNHPMGPLALADMIGLDTCLYIMETLYNETCDSKYRPHVKLRQLVRAGTLGRKTGKGIFDYTK